MTLSTTILLLTFGVYSGQSPTTIYFSTPTYCENAKIQLMEKYREKMMSAVCITSTGDLR